MNAADLIHVFLDEARDLGDMLEARLLELESEPTHRAAIDDAFRCLHTLKGAAGMFGLEAFGGHIHHLETAFEDAREGRRAVDTPLITATLGTVDVLRAIVAELEHTGAHTPGLYTDRLAGLLPPLGHAPAAAVTAPPATNSLGGTFRVSFRPQPGLAAFGHNPLLILRDLAEAGPCLSIAAEDALPALPVLNNEEAHLGWRALVYSPTGPQPIEDVFVFVQDLATVEVLWLSPDNWLENPAEHPRLAQWLRSNGTTPAAPAAQRQSDAPTAAMPGLELAAVTHQNQVRVPATALDHLMNLVSELVSLQARLSLMATTHTDHHGQWNNVAEGLETITRQLRDFTLDLRLLPIGSMFGRFDRLVRDLSLQLNKPAEFVKEGGATRLDKGVLEQLADPLLHLLRNCLDHGLETPAERTAAGKPATGTITLEATHKGAHVEITLSDDGRGIDLERVRQQAVARGWLAPDAAPDADTLLDFIFRPGLSTAEHVTDVSGRGVGMDVVRRRLTELRANIHIDTTPGHGTRFRLRLPHTLAIIDGLLARVAETHFVVPMAAIEACYEVPTAVLETAYGERVKLGDALAPYLLLRREFGIGSPPPERSYVVVINLDGHRVGIAFDALLGEYQAVLKPLGTLYQQSTLFSGASILGDGTLALVIDPLRFIEHYGNQQPVPTS